MSEAGLHAAITKMREAKVHEHAVTVFEHYYRRLEAGASGIIAEKDVIPLDNPPQLDDLSFDENNQRDALARTVVIKLNGGLGTSMGMTGPKSLVPVREGYTFFDIMCRQILAAREKYRVSLPLIFMNSFNTRDRTLRAAQAYPSLPVEGIPLDFVQSKEPKLDAHTLQPVSWPKNPDLEWCPPGHGDIYVSLLATGLLALLRKRGYRYLFVSNGDNLGATPSPHIAAWFAQSGAPYAPEITRRTVTDLKGGHIVRRRSDGRLILRETAQISDEEMKYFTDAQKHPYTHTNNLWINLDALERQLREHDGVLGMPLIVNKKTVDPTDPTSTPVIQLETAMGAAVEVFDASQAIAVPRSRFVPVKTTAELSLLRSDLYRLDDQWNIVAETSTRPDIRLDSRYFKTMRNYEAHFPYGVPSLRHATSLHVEGEWTFGKDVEIYGDVHLRDTGQEETVADHTILGKEETHA